MAKSIDIRERKIQHHRAKDEKKVYGLVLGDSNEIHIDPRQKEWQRMDSLIHELAHLALPEMKEKEVRSLTYVIRRGLWKQGYRRVLF